MTNRTGVIRNNIFWSAFVLLCSSLWVLSASSGCTNRQSGSIVKVDSTETPEQELWGSTVILSKNGTITSRIQAGHISRFKGRAETMLDSGVVVDFYDKDGKHTSVMTSKYGKVQGEQNDLYAWGNVVVTSDSGHVLRTAAIQWDHTTQKIRSDTFVTITTQLDTLHGYGLVSDDNLENWEIGQPTGETVRKLVIESHREKRVDTTSTKSPVDSTLQEKGNKTDSSHSE
jgi:LPS export ABC transporter protein LptC